MDRNDLFEFIGYLASVVFLIITAGVVVAVIAALAKMIFTLI